MREATYVLNVVHRDDDTSDVAIDTLRRHYQTRFAQEATLHVRQRACASF